MITNKYRETYQKAWNAAQAGGMNYSESHEFAEDQATRNEKDLTQKTPNFENSPEAFLMRD